MKRRGFWGGIAYGVLLTALTVFILLDTFVLERVYAQAGDEGAGDGDIAGKDSPVLTLVKVLGEYDDGQMTISVATYRGFDTDIHVADIRLTSSMQLQTAFAGDTYGKNIKERPSVMAERNQAILAINGDYYGAQEKGYVLRNGRIYRTSYSDGRQDLVIYEDGSMGIIDERETPLEALLDAGAVQVLSFGPALVEDSVISVQAEDLRGKDKTRNPRTAIGCIGALHYLFVVADGRTEESGGLTIPELAEVMEALGADTAYNLDGGGSSCMVFCGEVVNRPTTSGNRIKEREVSDIVYIGYGDAP